MERAKPHILTPLGLEREVLTDHAHDVRSIAHPLSIVMLWRKSAQSIPICSYKPGPDPKR